MNSVKKFGLAMIGFVLVFFVGSFTLAKDYEYTNLDIKADVKVDGTMDVAETFTVNFLKKKHGIIRFIPLNYTVDDTDFHIDLDFIRVDGNKFYTYVEDGGVNIRIGDPNLEIKGEKVYPIFYSVYGLIRNFAGMGYHELYWNLVGDDFDTNINSVRAEIKLPKKYSGFTSDDFLITVDGKTTSVKDFDGMVDWTSGDKIFVYYNKKLDAGEGITLAIKFPNNYFAFDYDRQVSLIGHVDAGSGYNSPKSGSSSFLSDFFSDSDSSSSILTFLIILFGMFFSPNKGGNWSHSSGGSYTRSGGFSRGSSFGGGFGRGGGGGGGGSRSW